MNQQEWNTTVDKLALDDLQKLRRGRTESERNAVQTCYRIAFGEQPEDKHEGILKAAPNERWWAACMTRWPEPKKTWEDHPTSQEEN